MDIIESVKECPIETMGYHIEKNMAYDGCYYYIPIHCKDAVLKYNETFSRMQCIKVSRKYTCMSYDYLEDCFWASCNECYGAIYKLNRCLKEIDKIHLDHPLCGAITGISYCGNDDSLIISLEDCVLKYSKREEKTSVIYRAPGYFITDVLSIYPAMLVILCKNHQQYFYVLDDCCQIVRIFSVPENFEIEHITLQPSQDCQDQIALHALARKHQCYPYVLTMLMDTCVLGDLPNWSNYWICEKRCENDLVYGSPDGCQCNCLDDCSDISKTIASMEKALLNILDDEGEKLKKVLDSTDDIDKMLCVNRQVNQKILHVTHMEHAIYAKLSALINDECDRLCCKVDKDCECEREKMNKKYTAPDCAD